MTSINDNKELVERFTSLFAQSDIDAVLGMMTEDATWWVNGKAHLNPGSGTKTKPDMARILENLYGQLIGGLRMDVAGIVAEGDKVAAELRSHATTTTGKIYENDYHMLFTVRDGKIAKVREYTDHMHANEIFG